MDIVQSPAGQIIKSLSGYKAFLPNPLPPLFKWNTQLVIALSRADFLLGKLAREGGKLPNPHLLIRPFIAREAVLSSKIEGTQATIGEILAASAGISVQRNPDDLNKNHVIPTDLPRRTRSCYHCFLLTSIAFLWVLVCQKCA